MLLYVSDFTFDTSRETFVPDIILKENMDGGGRVMMGVWGGGSDQVTVK